MPEFFEQARENFTLYGADARGWRPPQLGAIGATMAHWSLGETEPTVVSIPTGAGKTAVGMAAPFLHDHAPERVLVLSPSRQLREQLAEQFASLDQLRRVGVLSDGAGRPNVMQMAGRTDDWQSLRAFDVVVALPNSVSPVHYGEDEQPPDDLFDLIIVDEAHHAPAKTWRAILDHFPRARKLLLTATPRRRDGRRIPGSLRYYYPLRKALEEGLYNPITPHLLSVPEPNDRSASDLAVANRANDLLQQAAHTTSCLLVRGGTITRLEELQEIYKGVGIDLAVLHNRLSPTTQREIVERLSGGDLRAIGVVGMLGEGFDLPALRIAAYHDKHRSVPATVQLIGRLARVDPAFPQQSALITVADAEVYPELKGILKSLYEEDSDWAEVLPGILDEEIRQEHEDREFAEKLSPSRTEIDPLHLQPVKRAFVYELPADWQPEFLTQIPEGVEEGAILRGGGEVAFASADEETGIFALVVRYLDRPKWSSDPAMENVRYELNLAAFRRPPQTNLPALLLLNLESDGMRKRFEDLLGLERSQLADPERLGAYLDSLDRVSVSSVGIRSTNAATRGRATYKNFMGGDVDRGLRIVDLARSALGHVMFQIRMSDGSANAGGAIEKSKIWLTRYGSLREFSGWADGTAKLFWFPDQAPQGRLLPGIERGRRLDAWPDSPPLAAELHPALLGIGLQLSSDDANLGSIEDLELYVNDDPTGTLNDIDADPDQPLRIVGVLNDPEADQRTCVWEAHLELDGDITPLTDLRVSRGYGEPQPLSAILEAQPPTVYFRDGTTTIGALRYDSRGSADGFDPGPYLRSENWTQVDITAETRRTADERSGDLVSIHQELESLLVSQPRTGAKRWILLNDGAGEIADYIVIEDRGNGEVKVALWHAKAAGGSDASVRVKDLQEVVAQALRSRQWFTSTTLWSELAARFSQGKKPYATLVDGSDDQVSLEVRLGLAEDPNVVPWTQSFPSVRGLIGIAQPGLGLAEFQGQLREGTVPQGAAGLRQLLSVLADTTISDGADLSVLVSA